MAEQIPQALMPNEAYQEAQPAIMQPQIDAQGQVVPPLVPQVADMQFAQPQAESSVPDLAQYNIPQQKPAVPVAQPDLSAMQNLYGAQQKANEAIAKAAADKAVAEDQALELQQVRMAEQEKKMQEFQNKFNADYNSSLDMLSNINKQLNSADFANAKIDGNRYWNNMSTGSKILGGLAIALGAAGAALTGGENAAYKIIQGAIDRDIDEQKFNVLQKGKALEQQAQGAQNMLQTLRAKFGDDIAASNALRVMYNDSVQTKLKQLASRNDSKIVQENAKILNAKLEQEKMAANQALKQRLAIMARLGSGSNERVSETELMGLPEDMRKAIIADQEKSVTGFRGIAKDKESATAFQKTVSESVPAIDALKQLSVMTKEGTNWSPEKRAQVATQLQMVIGKLRLPLQGSGAMTESDYERLLKTVGNPNSILSMSSWERAKVQTVLKNLERDLAKQAETYGFRSEQKINVGATEYKK